jgi:hypothetical protein
VLTPAVTCLGPAHSNRYANATDNLHGWNGQRPARRDGRDTSGPMLRASTTDAPQASRFRNCYGRSHAFRTPVSFLVTLLAAILMMVCVTAAAQATPSGGGGSTSSIVPPGGLLLPGDTIVSPLGVFELAMQSDGNLAEYAPRGRVVWNSQTGGHPGAYAAMQSDGNLVVYSPSGQALWNSVTGGHVGAGAYLAIKDDAGLVVNTGSQQQLWTTGITVPTSTPPSTSPPPVDNSNRNITSIQTMWWGLHIRLSHADTQSTYQSVQAAGYVSSASLLSKLPASIGTAFQYIGCIGQFVNDLRNDDQGYGVNINVAYFAVFWTCGSYTVWAQ